MKIINNFFIFSILITLNSLCWGNETKLSPHDFFSQEAKKNQIETASIYSPQNTILSGVLAFTLGNVGFFTTKSKILKLGYSGVQTIGVINFGKGLYDLNMPNRDKVLSEIISSNPGKSSLTKEYIGQKLVELYARENRAKRISLLYGSSLLSTQYFINAFVGKPLKELQGIYLFLGGINLIIAGHSAINKTNYENYFFGDSFDISPVSLIQMTDSKKLAWGQGISINFHY